MAGEKLWIVTYNVDYEESIVVFRSREEAVADIASTFECEAKPDSAEFWIEAADIYARSNWKGFQFITLDLNTLETRTLL